MPLLFSRRTSLYKGGYLSFLIICFLMFVTSSGTLLAQCTTSGAQIIPDDGILTIDFAVSGLVDSDLASATQGICGVEIDFMHENIGDVTVTLISPSGTVVQLVGPPTTTNPGTNLTRWNIDFLPCMMAAMPDGGFAATWSNLQPWAALANYSGSYHPSSGCLEDFNSGSANGIWRIVFEDHDLLATGSVASVTLIFCNPAGLQCNECDPNAGTLTPPAMALCENQLVRTIDVTVDYAGNPPAPGLYSYTFILSSGNTIVANGASFNHDPIPGNYTLCGLSYLTTDAIQINNLILTGDLNMLIQAISNGSVCAVLSNPCVVVTVSPEPDTVEQDVILCTGQSFVFKGQLFSSPGTYHVVDDEVDACDSIFQLNITASDVIADIAIPDSISCGGAGVLLDGSSSQGGPLTYEWTTSAGILNGNINNSQVVALVPGAYTLTIRDGQCEDTEDVVVYGDQTYPQIFMEADVITCSTPTVTIHPVVSPSNVTYSWTGPGGFTSSMRDVDISIPGRYFLRVVSANGCEAFTYIDVMANITMPDANVVLQDKACASGFGVIGVSTAGNLYAWTGPTGMLPPNQVIAVTDAGLYSITVTDPGNGCTATGSLDYVPDYVTPPLDIVGIDSIRCNSEVLLTVTDANLLGPPVWSGPNGIYYNSYTVGLTQPGVYTINVIGANGCKNSRVIELFAASGYPAYQITNDTISCLDNIATIGITIPNADVYFWPDLPPPDNSNAFVTLMSAGTFTVTALDTTSGCLVEATASVTANTAPPPYSFITDTISCADPIGLLQFVPVPGQQHTSVEWHLPDMTIVTNPTLTISEPGQYLLSVTGQNGCIGTSLLTIEKDTVLPLFFLEPDVIGCDMQGIIHNIRVDSLAGIVWTGPNGFTSSELDPMISDTGIYTASGFSTNGCPRIVTTHVTGDFVPPLTSFTLDTLDCINPFAELIVHSPDEIIGYAWKDEAGTILSTDSILLADLPGSYTVEVEGDNHCFNQDTVILTPPVFPVVGVSSDTLSCDMGAVPVIATSNILNTQFTWLAINGDTLIKSDELIADNRGPFIISAVGPNGCETKDTILVPIDTLYPVATISLIGEIRCQNRDFMLDGQMSIPSNVEFTWSTVNGMILSDPTLPVIDAQDTGVYFLSIVNPVNGCVDVDSIHMGEHPDAITLAHIEVKRPQCSGESNAEILVTDIEGGVEPIFYSLDGSLQQSANLFDGLTAGSFLLEITDNAGCIYDTLITIDPTNPYTVNAGFDQEIFIGETAVLFGTTDILPEEVFSQEWDSVGVLLCQDCIESSVRPLKTTTYRFTVISETGCVKSDEVIIYVVEKAKFFIPNIFSPNGDNINDELIFSTGPGIVRVHKWLIFDRWGDQVFERLSFDPADPSVYWDGTATQGSEKLNPGVFTYIIDVELLTGKREIYYGSITLIR